MAINRVIPLEHNVVNLLQGPYTIKVIIGSGSAHLESQLGAEEFMMIPDTDKTASSIYNINISASKVRCVITGDAVVYASPM